MNATRDAATQFADEAGREGKRYFDEIISDHERINTNPDLEPVFEAIRELYRDASQRMQNNVTRILNLE